MSPSTSLLDEGKSYGPAGSSLKLIDLFCGAGGLSLGFASRFQSVWAVDNDEAAVQTYRENFGSHCQHGDIVSILESESHQIPNADVVIGGPPCQGFSLLNKGKEGDPRRHLWIPFLEVVQLCGADLFVMENVPQLLGTPEHKAIGDQARQVGFVVRHAKLLAADYGVPQTRTRAFIIGCRFADPACVFPPKRTHVNPKLDKINPNDYVSNPKPWRTVRDVIADLPVPCDTEIGPEPPLDLHFGRNPTALSLDRYRAIPEEGMNRENLLRAAPGLTPNCWVNKRGGTDLFGRLWWDRPAVTIRTEFFKPEKGRYLHPVQDRPITHREAARFQTFPDNFRFIGSKIAIAKQIGNAVPPDLASAVAEAVYSLLLQRLRV
ncbi:MAG: DNA cytosine methyltransferase [Armatimonadetes bacterium]|nr:DNA cytosine methyltransferase [Armatimonadota bacterium]